MSRVSHSSGSGGNHRCRTESEDQQIREQLFIAHDAKIRQLCTDWTLAHRRRAITGVTSSKRSQRFWRHLSKLNKNQSYWENLGNNVSSFLQDELINGENVFASQHKSHAIALDLLAMAQSRGNYRIAATPDEGRMNKWVSDLEFSKKHLALIALKRVVAVDENVRKKAEHDWQRVNTDLSNRYFTCSSSASHPVHVRKLRKVSVGFNKMFPPRTGGSDNVAKHAQAMDARRRLFNHLTDQQVAQAIGDLKDSIYRFGQSRTTTGSQRMTVTLNRRDLTARHQLLLIHSLVNQRLNKKNRFFAAFGLSVSPILRRADTTQHYNNLLNKLTKLNKPNTIIKRNDLVEKPSRKKVRFFIPNNAPYGLPVDNNGEGEHKGVEGRLR